MQSPTRKDRANAIRFLSLDAVEKANSGHPGMPMGMADVAEVLWHDILHHHPKAPKWINRDRFILSNGHGCMLQYALLHLTGYDLTIDDIKAFRQLHSKTPGHPEYGDTPGIETTTGPLGQGLANAVGMAIAEKHLSARFNQPEFPLIDHYTYCVVGDGCLMEGISHEVCSLAGMLGLNKLIVLYDDNRISIDGKVTGWFQDNTSQRFEAYGWHVISKVNGHDSDAVYDAILKAQQIKDRPTLICCETIIGFGSPKFAGTETIHGSPLGKEETIKVRELLQWPHSPFVIPSEIYASFNAKAKGEALVLAWETLFNRYEAAYPELARELKRRLSGELPTDWATSLEELITLTQTKIEAIATRKASQFCLNYLSVLLPELFGGSADLTESNCTLFKDATPFSKENPNGRYLHYGVREFGMSAIMNGLALYGGIIPFGGTFLTFSDYAKNAVRLSALMKQRVIFVYSHDSIGLGEDGPTHQPIEHLPGLRHIPGLFVWRPADLTETAVAWQIAIEHQGPTALLLTRQAIPHLKRTTKQCALIKKGAYIVWGDENTLPQVILLATGSEVSLAILAAEQLKTKNITARVVSMPCVEIFLNQDMTYQESVLPSAVTARIAIEAASSNFWYQFVGQAGAILGIDNFGASAPAKEVFNAYGFTVDNVVRLTQETLKDTAQITPLFHEEEQMKRKVEPLNLKK